MSYLINLSLKTKKGLHNWKRFIQDKKMVFSLIWSLLFLGASLIINFYAATYATEKASLPVTDIILSNIRVFDVDSIFVYGSIIFLFFTISASSHNPKKFIFCLKSVALFMIIRSIFISLTHIGPFPTETVMDSIALFNKFNFGGDLFFSGHTGLPFLMALIFWQEKILRHIFLTFSAIFAVIVLMGHLHYSIDVLGAFFITFTIFHISEYMFKKDRLLFYSTV